ncbi:MAG: hypothetical protein JWP63_1819 [Candidatus Solibacter sp.]|jgi:hypothetical protein|nr:hypothetical protein [Candidatus Solibacter sp.]
MASPAQITANQANARHSTGPRSDEGKSRVAQNAVRHGLTARHLVVRDDEREAFAAFHQGLAEELDPQGALESITFQELLHAAWNLERFSRIETEVSTGESADFTNPETVAVLDRLSRYQARSQRAFYKAQAELRTLQTDRALRLQELSEEDSAHLPAVISMNALTKQSQPDPTSDALDLALKMFDVEANQFLSGRRREREARKAGETR